MPVDLPKPPVDSRQPAPPKMIFWIVTFLVFMMLGGATTLLTWPKGDSTSTSWFWISLLGFPALAWILVFGLRLFYYNLESHRCNAQDQVGKEDHATAIEFASEPLAVLACSYLCAMGNSGVSSEIIATKSVLKAQTPGPRKGAIRYTSLPLTESKKRPGRFRPCFMDLLDRIKSTLAKVPKNVPFDVRLQLPANAQSEELLATWQECWLESGYPPAQVSWHSTEQGLMTLDQWLDVSGGPGLQKFTLFVAIQLHDTPTVNSAEAGVALLLGWPLVAERHNFPVLAMLHRPFETAAIKLKEDIVTTLLWGKATPDAVRHVWQTGLSKEDQAALIKAASELKLGIPMSEQLSGFHSLDNAIGYPGAAASWLAAALAIEAVQNTQESHMIASDEGALRLAIVQPVSNNNHQPKTTS